MKKIISVILTLAMIASAMSAMAITSSADATWRGSGNSTWNGEKDGSGIDYVEALYFENAPTIDGYVTEAEWGKRTIELYSEDLGTEGNQEPFYNSFFYWRSGDYYSNATAAQIWLRWDEDYFYVAALVKDNNGHSLKNGGDKAWNGDSLNFIIDKYGANSATDGEGYDYNIGTPWRDRDVIPNITVGYAQTAGGYTECHENRTDTGITAYSNPVFGEALAVVAPSEYLSDDPIGYHEDAVNGITTYEVAIPWKYIFENDLAFNYDSLTEEQKAPYTLTYTEYSLESGRPGRPGYNPGNEKGGIGQTFGMSLLVSCAAKGENSYSAIMCWGSGILNIQAERAPQTCAGSNQVTLVADKVEQGDYAKYDPSKLDNSNLESEYDTVFYDYLGGDLDRFTPLADSSLLTTLTYDDATHMEYWGSADLYQGSIINVGGEHGNVLNYDRVVTTHMDDDGKIHQAGVDPIDSFYIDTTVIPESYWNSGDGFAWLYPLSYTFEFDVMYTGNEIVQEGRKSELGNLFGGSSAEYYCGYDFDRGTFVIRPFSGWYNDIVAESDAFDLQANTWYNWKFQYDNDSCTARLLINDEVVFDVQNRYFYYSNEQNLENGTVLCWWFINTQMKMDNVKMYNFYDYESASAKGYSISGNVEINNTNDTLTDPVYVSLFNADTNELYDYVILDDTYEYEFTNVPKGNYIVDFERYTYKFHSVEFSLNNNKTIDVTLSLLGDVDLNGKINSIDLIRISKALKSIDKDLSYDVDYNNKINALDVIVLKKIIKSTYDFGGRIPSIYLSEETAYLPIPAKSAYQYASDLEFTIKFDSLKFELSSVSAGDESGYTLIKVDSGHYRLCITDDTYPDSVPVNDTLAKIGFKARVDTDFSEILESLILTEDYKIKK